MRSPPEPLRAFPRGGRHPWPGKAGSTVALAWAASVFCAVRMRMDSEGSP